MDAVYAPPLSEGREQERNATQINKTEDNFRNFIGRAVSGFYSQPAHYTKFQTYSGIKSIIGPDISWGFAESRYRRLIRSAADQTSIQEGLIAD